MHRFSRAEPGRAGRAALALTATLLLAPLLVSLLDRARADAIARSDGSPAALAEACRLDPGNDVYPILLAQRREELGQSALADWQRAIDLNPRRDLSLTQAAIAAEFAGDLARAERLLEQAERYNHLWLPRWSLAGFYARRGDWPRVLAWARPALERAYNDRTPLFRLCREAGASEEAMLNRILPDDPANRAAFLDFVVAEGPSESIEPAAARLIETRSRGHLASALRAIETLAAASRPRAAVRLWNQLAGAGLIPYPAHRADAPLTNPGLLPPLQPPALDWQIAAVAGVESRRGVPTGGIKFTFSGRQEESAELLAQSVYLPRGSAWRLDFEYQTRGVSPAQSGLYWALQPAGDGPALATVDDWQTGHACWPMTEGDGLHRLSFHFRRPSGQTRIEGEVWLRGLTLHPVEACP